MRAPELPIGCPSAIAPPLTLTRAGSRSSPRMQARLCAANASFSSIKSRFGARRPARASAFFVAGIGPSPMKAGSTPAVAETTKRASGVTPDAFTASSLARSTAAAPSLIGDEFPAVTVPPARKAGASLASFSSVVSGRGDSSFAKRIDSPFGAGIGTGTISRANAPASHAAPAFFCDASAKASCSSRPIPPFFATFSAVSPMLWSSKRAAIFGFG